RGGIIAGDLALLRAAGRSGLFFETGGGLSSAGAFRAVFSAFFRADSASSKDRLDGARRGGTDGFGPANEVVSLLFGVDLEPTFESGREPLSEVARARAFGEPLLDGFVAALSIPRPLAPEAAMAVLDS